MEELIGGCSACHSAFAEKDCFVELVDINAATVAPSQRRKMPFMEEGPDALHGKGIGRRATVRYNQLWVLGRW